MDQKFFTVRNIVLVGLLSAMTFVMTGITLFAIVTPLGKIAVHMGNIMCLLSALLFGPWAGALSAGIGSALYDLSDPAWAPEFWLTFINKFAMALVAGYAMKMLGRLPALARTAVSSLLGALTYFVLHLVKNIFYNGMLIKHFTFQVALAETLVGKAPVSLVNNVLAVVCATLLCMALRPALRKAHILGM